jgi:hypothetical protein
VDFGAATREQPPSGDAIDAEYTVISVEERRRDE